MSASLKQRREALHREMLEQFERTAAAEHHWLIYVLLGWEMLAACAVSHYFVAVLELQIPHRWPYFVLWMVQTGLAILTVKLVSNWGPRTEESPIEPMNKRLWLMFIFLSFNVAILNVISGQAVFEFLPTLAALSSLAFTALTCFVSRRFTLAGLLMFVTGILIAYFPQYGFLIYGAGWWLVLEVLGVVFLVKRRRWLGEVNTTCVAASRINSPRLVSPGR
jgi:hypothetical protein